MSFVEEEDCSVQKGSLFFYGCTDDRLSVDVQLRALVSILKSGMHFNGRRDKIISELILKKK